MNLETLKDIVQLAKSEGVAELVVNSEAFTVEVRFASAFVNPVQASQPMMYAAPQAPASTAAASATSTASAAKAASDAGLHVIKSPFVGTFYASPGPGKPVYTKLGDKVKAGQALCVLEAMKIMNEIDADISGEVVEICVDNESLVEFGQALFKIRPN